MGCDIHLYLEYNTHGSWNGTPEMDISRDYGLFTVLAGVRSYDSKIDFIPPRGIPKDIAWDTASGYTLYVRSSDNDTEHSCSRESAERWVKEGNSEWWDGGSNRVTSPDWHSASWLTLDEFKETYAKYLGHYTAPDIPERDDYLDINDGAFETLRELAWSSNKRKPISPILEMEACIGYLEALRKFTDQLRVVFWFDN